MNVLLEANEQSEKRLFDFLKNESGSKESLCLTPTQQTCDNCLGEGHKSNDKNDNNSWFNNNNKGNNNVIGNNCNKKHLQFTLK